MNALTLEIPTARYFRYFFGRYLVFFGFCYTNVGIGIWEYRGIGSVSVLPTQAYSVVRTQNDFFTKLRFGRSNGILWHNRALRSIPR